MRPIGDLEQLSAIDGIGPSVAAAFIAGGHSPGISRM